MSNCDSACCYQTHFHVTKFVSCSRLGNMINRRRTFWSFVQWHMVQPISLSHKLDGGQPMAVVPLSYWHTRACNEIRVESWSRKVWWTEGDHVLLFGAPACDWRNWMFSFTLWLVAVFQESVGHRVVQRASASWWPCSFLYAVDIHRCMSVSS